MSRYSLPSLTAATALLGALAGRPPWAPDAEPTAASRAAAPTVPGVIDVAAPNSRTAITRDRCLQIAVSETVAYTCGDLRISHPLPTTTTRGRARTPLLVYNSQHADPRPLVHADVQIPSGLSGSQSVTLTLSVAGLTATRVEPASRWGAGGPTAVRRVTLDPYAGAPANTPRLATGAYPYTVTVTWGGGTYSVGSMLLVVNRQQSGFGEGWWLAGHEQLFGLPNGTAAETADSLLWVGGDGSARVYRRRFATGTDFFADTVTRLDSLTRLSNGTMLRWLPGGGGLQGARVQFNRYGRHDETIDRLGQRTIFGYFGTNGPDALSFRLANVSVPPATAALAYYFLYDASAKVQMVAAPQTNGVPRNTFLHVANGRLLDVIDPDGNGIVLGYGTRLEWYRGRGSTTTLHYVYFDPYGRLTQVARYTDWLVGGGQGGPIVSHLFCAADVRTLPSSTHCTGGTVPEDPATWRTTYDGPRPASVGDTASFWPDRFGGVRRIVNALGHETLITPDATFPGLAQKVRDYSGLETDAVYTARGLPQTVRVLSPYGTGINATTTYTWHGVWDQPLSITSPQGVVTEFDYDGYGNRLWQQTGGFARRVSFDYRPVGAAADAGLLERIRQPIIGTSDAAQAFTYDALLGNLGSVSGPGPAYAEYVSDVAGRVARSRTLVAGTPGTGSARWLVDTLRYDAVGQVVYDSTGADALGTVGASDYRPASGFVVTRAYTGSNRDSVVTRKAAPGDGGNIGAMRTEWRYDGLGRLVKEIAPDPTPADTADGPVERRTYDLASNVETITTRRGDVLSMTYDALGRLATRTLPQVTYARRREGIATSRKPVGEPAYPRYENGPDSLNALRIFGETHVFTYDPMGRVLTANGPDAEVTRTYHRNGLPQTETLKVRTTLGAAVDGTHAYLTSYAYDLDGRRTAITYPSQLAPSTGAGAQYTYDPLTGELATVTDPLGKVYQYGYTTRGEVESLNRPGGILERWRYTAAGEVSYDSLYNYVTGVAYPHPTNPMRAAAFAYDVRGKLLSMGNAAGLHDQLTSTYDGLGQVATTTFQTAAVGILGVVNATSSDAMTHDGLGNLLANSTTTSGQTRDFFSTSATPQVYVYQPNTGRLGKLTVGGTRSDTLTYDAAGQTVFSTFFAQSFTNAVVEDRASFYAADGTVRIADARVLGTTGPLIGSLPYRGTYEEYRYDALGRRVWVRARRACVNEGGDAREAECNLSTVRRTVWDGAQELGEIQMPDDANAENDVAALAKRTAPTTSDPLFNADRFFGRVAYTYGHGVDQPLGVTRLGYQDAAGALSVFAFPAFTLSALWNHRGQAENGAFDDGAQRRCLADGGGNTRCVAVEWPAGWFPYNKPFYVPVAWHGTLAEDKRDKAGTLYRRARVYDPAAGRFTQEDPIGLAGGVNLYGYAGADPVSFSDPFGLRASCLPCRLALAGARGGAVAGGAAGTVVPVLGNGVGAVAGGIIGGLAGVGIGLWLAEKADDSWKGLSEEELKGKSPEEVEEAIPGDWTREPSRTGGTRYKHPTNRGEQIRVQPGKSTDPNPAKQGPYCRISRCGKTSDPIPLKGNPTIPQQ